MIYTYGSINILMFGSLFSSVIFVFAMPLHSISQETVFYTGFWDRQKERFLFGKFEFETWMGNWVPGQHEVNKAVVDRTRPAFRHQYDVDLPIEEYN